MGVRYIKDPEEEVKEPTPPVPVEQSCTETLRMPCIFSAKIILALSILYWLIYLVPVYGEALEVSVSIVWFGSALLLSLNKVYAGLIVTVVSGYNFVHDLLVELPKFGHKAVQVATTHNIAQSTASTSLIILLSLEAVFLLCFLYYAIYILPPRRKYPF